MQTIERSGKTLRLCLRCAIFCRSSRQRCSIALDQSLFDPQMTIPEIAQESTRSFDQVPGPKGVYGLPYLGVALHLEPFTRFSPRRIDKLARAWHEEYGDIYRVRLPHKWNVFVFDPKDVETVFRNDQHFPFRRSLPLFEHYNKRRNMTPTIGERNNEDWWDLRKPAQEVLAKPSSIAKLLPQTCEIADDFVYRCRHERKLTGLPQPMMEYTSEVSGMLCFNTRLGCVNRDSGCGNPNYMKHVKNYFEYFGEQMFALVPWYKWFQTPGYSKFEAAADFFVETTKRHIEKTLSEPPKESEGFNLLRHLMSLPGMDEEKTTALLVDFFRGGVDSTANAMTFFIYNLAKNPDVQEKLYKELENNIEKEGVITENTLRNLSYLKACLKESFRMVYPVILGTQRETQKDLVLNGYNIPAGTVINFCLSIICQKEEQFSNPEVFYPERWLRGHPDRSHHHPFSFMPFGFGKRNCVGQRFAEQQIFLCISKLVRNFRLHLPANQKPVKHEYLTFARACSNFNILLEERK